jgi:hypothetical protein
LAIEDQQPRCIVQQQKDLVVEKIIDFEIERTRSQNQLDKVEVV